MKAERAGAKPRTPWRAWFASAVHAGIAPDAFWRLSLAEWRAILGPNTAMTRTELNALERRFPDDDHEPTR